MASKTTPRHSAEFLNLNAALFGLEEDITRLTAFLDYMDAHADEDTYGLTSAVRAMTSRLGTHADLVRKAAQ